MGAPIAFWYNRKRDFIMNPPHHSIPTPPGYEKIECRHAHEVEKWSARLRAQDKRLAEMNDIERYEFEDALRADGIAAARKELMTVSDPFNRQIANEIIRRMVESREKHARPIQVESAMTCESKEGVAP